MHSMSYVPLGHGGVLRSLRLLSLASRVFSTFASQCGASPPSYLFHVRVAPAPFLERPWPGAYTSVRLRPSLGAPLGTSRG
eukprot:5851628-Pyramimonas_sp.AAC.1